MKNIHSEHSCTVWTDGRTEMTKLVVFSPVDLWTNLKTLQNNQGAVRVSTQIPPKYKFTPNSSDQLRTEPSHLLETAKRPEQCLEGWVLSYLFCEPSKENPFQELALGVSLSASTAGTTVICLGDMCWLIRQFDIKLWRLLRNQSV